jgi:hypothetical protein
MSDPHPPSAVDAVLLVAPACPHCAAVLEGLGALVKDGTIGRLEVINAAVHPHAAQSRGARSVPWFAIGPFRFDAAMGAAEMRRWAATAGDTGGMAGYFLEMLKSGRRRHVEALLREDSRHGLALVALLDDAAASMAVRLGIGAVLESLQGSTATHAMIPGLGAMTRSADARLRADACHFLALIGTAQTLPYFEGCLGDDDAEVREIAAEALAAPRTA